MPRHAARPSLSRRRLLTGAAASAAVALVAACGGETAPTVTSAAPVRTAVPATSGTTPTTGAAMTMPAPAATRTGAMPRGELRYVTAINFPVTTDATKGGYNMITYACGETLTRLTPQNRLEPFLAESYANVNPTTWRVTLRQGAKFWDGSPVTAEAVAASFRTNWETQPSANTLIDKSTTVNVVNASTLEFTLPRPAGNFPYALSSQFFVVHKDAGKVMTGPYRPVKFEADREMILEPFTEHWGGPPPIARIVVRNVPYATTRALALQSGEADMIGSVLPETLRTFGPEIESVSVPSTRMHMTLLNAGRAPFDDRAVREATAHAIDRAALLRATLDGQGEAATAMFPSNAGLELVPLQTFDAARARVLLDEAGWRPGADGVRAKEGKRLAFTLLTYPGRPELTQMATAMQAQLKTLGYDANVREVMNITEAIKDGNFDASMLSVNALISGDPQYFYGVSVTRDALYNYGKTVVPSVDPLFAQLRDEADPAKRQAISRQIQEAARAFVPNLYLAAAPLIFAYRKNKVRGFVAHPNDLYLFNTAMSVA